MKLINTMLAATLLLSGNALAFVINNAFQAEQAFDEASPPEGWFLRDQEDRALISSASFALAGDNVFRFERLRRGFGANKLEQCVPVNTANPFQFGVWVRTATPHEDLSLRLNIEFYSAKGNCEERLLRNDQVGNDDFDFGLDIQPNVWTEFASEPYSPGDFAGQNITWARISIRVRDRTDEGDPSDPPRIVYLDGVWASGGDVVVNHDFALVDFPDQLDFDEDSGPIGWTMRDVLSGATVEVTDFARRGNRVFYFNELSEAFGDNKLEQCIALPSGSAGVRFSTWVHTPQPDPGLGVRLNMDFYPGLNECLDRDERIQRTDTDVFITPDSFAPDTWQRIETTTVDVTELPSTATHVRIRISARDQSNDGLPGGLVLYFDDVATNLVNPQITGGWYDPATDGQGFNFQTSPVGLFGYYYGYGAGERLWLVTVPVQAPIVFGQPIELTVLGPQGGVFGDPIDPGQADPFFWGRLILQFDSCSSGQAVLEGEDGVQAFDLALLSGVAGLNDGCTGPVVTDAPVDLTGAWYDPSTAGEGWNLLYTPGGLFGYFYGYSADGEPLWLGSNIQPVTLGEPTTLTLVTGEGGDFTAPIPPSGLIPWGELEVNFSNCNTATAEVTGVDGSQTLNLFKLAPAQGLPGCE